MENESSHFRHIFWFCAALTAFAVVFDACMVWVPIPKDNQKYADVLLGSLNTGALMAGIQFLLGGNATPKKGQTPIIQQTGENPTANTTSIPGFQPSTDVVSEPPTGGSGVPDKL